MALTRTLKLTLPRMMVGKDVEAHKRGVARALGSGRLTTLMSKAPLVRRTFGPFFVTDVKRVQELAGISQSGVIGPATHDLIYDHMDDLAVRLLKEYAASVRPKIPQLGPVILGGQSVLAHDLTHATAGIPGYPAFDDGFGQAGALVVAPEPLAITRQSSSQGGDAFYARGQSSIEYWFGHIYGPPATGSWIGKGERLARIANISIADGGPHVHVGINATPLIGRELEHRTDYSHGATPIGVQLERWLRT